LTASSFCVCLKFPPRALSPVMRRYCFMSWFFTQLTIVWAASDQWAKCWMALSNSCKDSLLSWILALSCDQ
jgi:hypothetical protein